MSDKHLVNVLKCLVIDGVNRANSGHPGGAMSSMDFAYRLFTEHMKFDPDNPNWQGRDRFILSAGHESMLIYSLLFANGWLEQKDLENFRQLHSRTPGHPENYMTPGVECTTGPLGQGAAMSVGFAIGASQMAANLGSELFDNYTWVLMGDGCMQECVTLSSASLAGHLGLNKLIWYYDKNNAQISGHISRAVSDDFAKVFAGFGWNVIEIDGHNHQDIDRAISAAKTEKKRPTLIIGNSVMAKGAATLEGSHETHGAPLSKDERLRTRVAMGLPAEGEFTFTNEDRQVYQRNFAKLRAQVKSWYGKFEEQMNKNGDFKNKYFQYHGKQNFDQLPSFPWPKGKDVATRNAFGDCLQHWADAIPNLIGGSADLEPSNMTGAFAKKVKDFNRENRQGRNLAFGVREFSMSAVSNGLALYGGFIPFDATFLSFADYSRAALRLGAIQRVRVIHEFTHDSFYLGEDGPTHQPIEQVMSLRAMPQMYVMRPADAYETEVMFKQALKLSMPSSICLTRQKLPLIEGVLSQSQNVARGAWVVKEAKDPEVVIFATGSEVSLALKSAELLGNRRVKVVSVPCWELFFEQSKEYQDSILTWSCKNRVSIEAGITTGWQKFVGFDGLMIGVDHYGESAPAEELEKLYGFVPASVSSAINKRFFS